jgi:recombination associated protein RdgC
MFRSARFFSLESPWAGSEEELSERLFGAAFKPCGPFTERSSGWESPAGETQGLLARRVAGADLLRLRSQARVLPTAAVNEALEERLDEYRARTREEPGRREKRKLKEQTRDELLPKALLKSERTNGIFIVSEQIIAIDTASDSKAERFLEQLRAPLGDLKAQPLAFKRPITDLMTRVFGGDAPPQFSLGRECRMQDPSDSKGIVRWQDVDLTHSTVRKCIKDGMQLTHLGIEFGNVMSGVIDANGAISKLRLLGMDEPPQGAGEDPLAQLDAELALLSGTLRELIVSLKRTLGAA